MITSEYQQARLKQLQDKMYELEEQMIKEKDDRILGIKWNVVRKRIHRLMKELKRDYGGLREDGNDNLNSQDGQW